MAISILISYAASFTFCLDRAIVSANDANGLTIHTTPLLKTLRLADNNGRGISVEL